jgi:16S rRNA (guanine527-N7)-methyltransferase
MTAALRPELEAGAAALGVQLTSRQVDQLLDYLKLMRKWNQVYNLTAVREPHAMLTHHLLDSLAVVQPLRRHTGTRAARLLDVGAGAGLPGVVIAIGCPEVAVTCVDAVAKKAAFVQQVAASLTLPNLRGLHARVETLGARGIAPFDVISSRAFATLADFVSGSEAALAEGGCWLAMKGRHPGEEIAALPAGIEVFHVEPLQVPDLHAERCVIWMRKAPVSG